MATIAQIVESERGNREHIHLYKEGMFLKAYQHSAFLFFTQVRQFKPIKKYYKSTACDVILLGFPSERLREIFSEEQITVIDEMHVVIPCKELNDETYRKWFDSIEPQPEKEKPQAKSQLTFEMQSQPPVREIYITPETDPKDLLYRKIVRQIELFSIESATPLDCMLFMSKLKTELKNGGYGGL